MAISVDLSERIHALLQVNKGVSRFTTSDGRVITMYFKELTKEYVTTLLASSLANRIIDEAQVEAMTKAMLAGNWTPESGTGIMIRKSQGGRLYQSGGHHTCHAYLRALERNPMLEGIDVFTKITTNSQAALNANLGKKATIHDSFMMSEGTKFKNKEDASAGSAFIKCLTAQFYKAQGKDAVDHQSLVKIAELVDEEVKYADAFIKASTSARNYLLTVHVLMSLLGRRADADEYVSKIVTGIGLRENEPSWYVERCLGEHKKPEKFNKRVSEQAWALVFIGAYKHITGNKMASLRVPGEVSYVTYARDLWAAVLDKDRGNAHEFWVAYKQAVDEARVAKPKAKAKITRKVRLTSYGKAPAASQKPKPDYMPEVEAGQGANRDRRPGEPLMHHPV